MTTPKEIERETVLDLIGEAIEGQQQGYYQQVPIRAAAVAAVAALEASGRVVARWCEECGGSGLVPEDHGQGMVEYLGCPDCMGTGIRSGSEK